MFKNQDVTLTATPGSGSVFSGWGGACAASGKQGSCKLKLSESRAVVANFGPDCQGNPTLKGCPLGPVKNPTTTTATFDGKSLSVRLKCPARFKPACLGKAVPVALKTKKGKPMATAKKTTIKSNRWKTTTFLIKPAYRNKVKAMTKLDKKLLFTKQLIRSKKIGGKKNQKTSTVFHVYKVRISV